MPGTSGPGSVSENVASNDLVEHKGHEELHRVREGVTDLVLEGRAFASRVGSNHVTFRLDANDTNVDDHVHDDSPVFQIAEIQAPPIGDDDGKYDPYQADKVQIKLGEKTHVGQCP